MGSKGGFVLHIPSDACHHGVSDLRRQRGNLSPRQASRQREGAHLLPTAKRARPGNVLVNTPLSPEQTIRFSFYLSAFRSSHSIVPLLHHTMQRILSRVCSRVSRHHSDDAQPTEASTHSMQLAEGVSQPDQIRRELATLSARLCDGHLSKVDLLIEDNGLQLGLSFSREFQSEIPTETRIYSAQRGPSGVDLAACCSIIKDRLSAETLPLAREEIRRLNSVSPPDESATSSRLSGSRTILLSDIDKSRLTQVTCVGPQEPHLILGAYRIPSNQDACLASLSLGVLVQNGDPSGGLRLRPFQPGSTLLKTENEDLRARARDRVEGDDSCDSDDSE